MASHVKILGSLGKCIKVYTHYPLAFELARCALMMRDAAVLHCVRIYSFIKSERILSLDSTADCSTRRLEVRN